MQVQNNFYLLKEYEINYHRENLFLLSLFSYCSGKWIAMAY